MLVPSTVFISVVVFVEASDLRKAIIAHERALEWQELFELCVKEALSEDEVKRVAYRVAGPCLRSILIEWI